MDGDPPLPLEQVIGGVFVLTIYPVKWELASATEPATLVLLGIDLAALGLNLRKAVS